MTLEDLFKKYPDLDDPKVGGVEFYQYVEGDPNKDNLVVITSLDQRPGERSFSGDEGKVGTYLLNFPWNARQLEFETIDAIDAHLTKNNNTFMLP